MRQILTGSRLLRGELSFPSSLLRILTAKESSILVAVLSMVVFFSLTTGGKYLSVGNILSILRQISRVGIIAVPLTFLIISQEYDLSVGAISSLCPIIAGLLVHNVGLSIWLAAPVGIAFGALFGAMNGVITTKLRITSFIATLGTMFVLKGVASIITGGRTVGYLPPSRFYSLLGGDLFGIIPMGAVWFAVVTVCFWIVLEHTAYGNKVTATGGNTEAARMLGVNTDKVKIINFVLVGAFSAFAGLVVLSDLGQMQAMGGRLLPFEAIAAVVIGGTSLFGGFGTVLGTFLGAFIMGGVRNGIMLMGFIGYWPDVFLGLVILAAASVKIVFSARRGVS